MFCTVKGISGMRITCAAGDARVQRDPASIPSHHFDHHHAMARFRRSVNLVDRIGCGVHRGISKPKVTSVAQRSLSIVLGTATILMPF